MLVQIEELKDKLALSNQPPPEDGEDFLAHQQTLRDVAELFRQSAVNAAAVSVLNTYLSCVLNTLLSIYWQCVELQVKRAEVMMLQYTRLRDASVYVFYGS